MMFSEDQKRMLEAPLSRENVKTRRQGGKTLSFIEGWHAIAEANRIFGFDGWWRETLDVECVVEKERKIGVTETFAGYDGWGVTYTCKVRIRVGGIAREGCGTGHGIDRDVGQAHESAIKEAETDAMKRALSTFGNQFGLALYDKEQANVEDAPAPPRRSADDGYFANVPGPPPRSQTDLGATERYIAGCKQTIEDFGTDTHKMMLWWNSDAQKAARRKYLSEGEMEVLKALVISKLPERTDGS